MFEQIYKLLWPAPEPNLILKKLPYDVFWLIFKLLDLRDLVKCRQVCKTFRSAVDSSSFRELFVFDEWRKYENASWFRSDRPIHLRNSIRLSSIYYSSGIRCQTILHNPVFQSRFAGLKFLSLRFEVWVPYLDALSLFVELQELWILSVFAYSYGSARPTLSLPKLEKIAFSLVTDESHSAGSRSSHARSPDTHSPDPRPSDPSSPEPRSPDPFVLLDTPSLEIVRVERNLDLVQFNFGETVKFLQIENCEPFGLLKQFRSFKNLECFSCTDPEFLKELDVLKIKPDLKRILCHRHQSGNELDVIRNLLAQASERNLPVEIYFESQPVKYMSDLKKLVANF